MTITYKTKGTCSSKMTAEVEDGVIRSLQVEEAVTAISRASPSWWSECRWRM